MGEFVLLRERDAWGPIRGFVYQVDLTIERWLGLAEGDVLLLECGEDIDLARRSMAGDSAAERELEQVKYREASLTLRDPAAVAALANAVEHRQANPGLKLLFRFTTNAPIGRERPSPLPGRMPAIEAWEKVRAGTLEPALAAAKLDRLRAFLRKRPKPADFNNDTWGRFTRFFQSADHGQLRDLIGDFEWATASPQAEDMAGRMAAMLVRDGYAAGPRQAEHQYQRLFLHVFKLLAGRGVKRLTVTDRTSRLSLPPLSEADRDLLTALNRRFSHLESRVAAIERHAAEQTVTIDGKLQALARSVGITAVVGQVIVETSLEVPPAVVRRSGRAETVRDLLARLQSAAWIALYGTAGSGKSELAKLLAEATDGPRLWVLMRDLGAVEAVARVDAAVRAVANEPNSTAWRTAYARFWAAAGHRAVLVLDDAPDVDGDDEMSQRLTILIAARGELDGHLITTGTHAPAVRFREMLGDGTLLAVPSPPLRDAEAAEVLAAHGAPPGWLGAKWVEFINAAAGYHPAVLAAAARYCNRSQWRLSGDEFSALLKGSYAEELRGSVVRRLAAEVADAASHQLLYRLNLILGTFSRAEVLTVADVQPAIQNPVERLEELIDVCVQRESGGRLRVSPLFLRLGTDDVPEPTRKTCHVRLAEMIVGRERVSPYDVQSALAHFVSSGEWVRAGVLLLRSLASLAESDPPIDAGLLPSVWADQPLPVEIDLGLRIAIRANQIRLGHHMGQPAEFAAGDLDVLLGQAADAEAWAVLIAGVNVQGPYAKTDLPRANHYLRLALSASPRVEGRLAEHGVPFGEVRPEMLVWGNSLFVRTPAELNDWIETVDTVPRERIADLFRGDVAEGGCMHMADRLWMTESDKPAPERQWPPVLAALERAAGWAKRRGVTLLQGTTTRARIVVLAEYLKDLDATLALAEETLAATSGDARVSFLVRECVGRQFVYLKRGREAEPWLRQALADAGEALPQQRVAALLHLGAVTLDASEAVALGRQAVSAARRSEQLGELALAKALGELAIAVWRHEGVVAAFQPFAEAHEHLFATTDRDEGWRATAVSLGHVGGYLASLATTGQPPQRTPEGEPYLAPEPGWLWVTNLRLAELYDSSREPLLLAQLAAFAEGIGETAAAASLASRALDAGRAGNQILTIAGVGHGHLVVLAAAGRYADAIDLGVEVGAALVVLEARRKAGRDVYTSDGSIDDVLGPRSSPPWREADRQAVVIAVVPVALRLATLHMSDPASAAAGALEAQCACSMLADGASEPEMWLEAANLFDAIFMNPTQGHELVARGKQVNEAGWSGLVLVANLGATLQQDLQLPDAANGHAHVARQLLGMSSTGTTPLHRLVLTFLFTYWTNVVDRQSFCFTPPAYYRQAVRQAAAEPEPRRAQVLLRTVFQGLNVPPPTTVARWLSS